MPKLGQYISLGTVADLLGVSRSTARKWLDDAGVPAVVLGSGPSGTIRYLERDVLAYVREQEEAEGDSDEDEAADDESDEDEAADDESDEDDLDSGEDFEDDE